ncbi:carboxymuconolactone decarboxylase family protein [soil metagenome]
MTTEYTIDLAPETLATADGGAKAVLERAQKSLGFVPNMYGGMAVVPAVLDTYLDGYKRFREETGFTPAEQEVVFLAISDFNGCGYCMAAHSMIADRMSKVQERSLAALRAGEPLPDAKLEALRQFTVQMVESRGNPTEEQVAAFRQAGFEAQHIPAIILAIAVKTLSNYSNHIFKPDVDERFADYKL